MAFVAPRKFQTQTESGTDRYASIDGFEPGYVHIAYSSRTTIGMLLMSFSVVSSCTGWPLPPWFGVGGARLAFEATEEIMTGDKWRARAASFRILGAWCVDR